VPPQQKERGSRQTEERPAARDTHQPSELECHFTAIPLFRHCGVEGSLLEEWG
jgi:hypothetical protein